MTLWQIEGWPTAEEWQAWWAFMTVVVAGIAAWFALRQYRASVRSHLEQARPYITVDFYFIRGMAVSLEVKNYGSTAAEDIKFEWSERPVASDARAQAAIDRSLVDGGIAFLAPGRAIRFYLSEFTDETTPRTYRVSATYLGSGDSERWSSKSSLDLDQWAEALIDRDPFESIVSPLKDIAHQGRSKALGSLGPPIEKRAAESLFAYLESTPEVKKYRRKKAREIATHNREVDERLRGKRVRFASEEHEGTDAAPPV